MQVSIDISLGGLAVFLVDQVTQQPIVYDKWLIISYMQ